MEKKNKKLARGARTTAVRMTAPEPIEKILHRIHDCRDCMLCYKLINGFYTCAAGMLDNENEPVQFKFHRICDCEFFRQ